MAVTVSSKARRIKGKTRYCVVVRGVSKTVRGFKGKGSGMQFHGCFKAASAASARVAQLKKKFRA